MPWQRPIDLVHLAKQTLGDASLEMEVLRMFDDRIAAYYSRLEMSTSVGRLQEHLHSIRAASAGVGAFGVADLARVAEDELAAGMPVNPERIDDLGMAIEEVRTFIGELLSIEPE